MKKKFWIAFSAVVATLIGIMITAFACGTRVDRDALIGEAKVKAEEDIANYPYESLNITYNRTWVFDDVTYYYYKITVAFAEDIEDPYQTMWNVLTRLDSSSFQIDCYTEGDIVFQEYATYQGNTYQIDYVDQYVLECLENYKFEYVTTTLKKIEAPYVGMSDKLINHTELGKPYDHEIDKVSITRIDIYYFLSKDGKKKYTVKCKKGKVILAYTSSARKSSSKSSGSSKKNNSYNVSDYGNEDDFYDDYYDDFIDYEEAEDYYNSH